MSELLNEEMQTPAPEAAPQPQRPRRRKAPAKKVLPFRLPAFLSNIGQDVRWYYDVRLWSPLILVLLVIAFALGRPAKSTKPVSNLPAPTVPAVVETQPVTEPFVPNPDAEGLARLADSVGAGRSDNAKIIIMWVAINRMEDRANGYGLSLLEEIARPNQWQGYDENIKYSQHTYELAEEVLDTIARGGLRPLDPGMLWLVLNDNGSVTVRNQFTAKAGQPWVEKTVS